MFFFICCVRWIYYFDIIKNHSLNSAQLLRPGRLVLSGYSDSHGINFSCCGSVCGLLNSIEEVLFTLPPLFCYF